MAGSGTRGNESEGAAEAARVADGEAPVDGGSRGSAEEPERITRRFPKSRVSRAERDRMVEEARAIKFAVAVRGYERAAVDRYVQHVNRLIAELEISSSSESAVRHALAEVSEETREILQQAHETADEVLLRSRAKADDTVQEAEREAQEVRNTAQREAIEARELARHEAEELLASTRREVAELREAATQEATDLQESAGRGAEQVRAAARADAEKMLRTAREESDELLKISERHARELGENADQIWRERRRLIEDVRVVGEQLLAIGEAESNRFPRPTEKTESASGPSLEPSRATAELAPTLQDTVGSSAAVGEAT